MQQNIDRYEIRRELGRGGMSTVYLAFDPRFRRQVAIKVLPRQFTHDPKYLARFEQEAQMVATLEHRAIVPVYDYGDFNDAPYLVMRYMPGGTLASRLAGKPMPLDQIALLLKRLAPALDKAHESNIIHRDLKPGNILFDADGDPFLADFGIARLAEASQTMTVVGTPAYMSPEQVGGDLELDGRADIYSLGVVLYELFSGEQPYEGNTPTKQMMAHVLEPVPDVLKANPALPPDAQTIINKTMAKDRENRYSTTEEVARAVALLAEGRPLPESDPIAAAVPVSTKPALESEEHLEPSPVSGTAADQVDAGGVVPPVTPATGEPTAEGGFPGWVWWAAALTALVVVVFVVRSIMSGNAQSTATSEDAVSAVVQSTSSPAPTDTSVPASHTPRPSATTKSMAISVPEETTRPTSTGTATKTKKPTSTPTTEPTASHTPELEEADSTSAPMVEVIFESVNFRKGPGVIYDPVPNKSFLWAGETAEVLGRSSDGTWFNVILDSGIRGWIAVNVVKLLNFDAADEILKAATIPAPPALTPTKTSTPTRLPTSEPIVAPTSSTSSNEPKPKTPTPKPPDEPTPKPPDEPTPKPPDPPTPKPPPKPTPG